MAHTKYSLSETSLVQTQLTANIYPRQYSGVGRSAFLTWGRGGEGREEKGAGGGAWRGEGGEGREEGGAGRGEARRRREGRGGKVYTKAVYQNID